MSEKNVLSRDMDRQIILTADNNYEDVDRWLKENRVRRLFLVHGRSIRGMAIGRYFENVSSRFPIDIIGFCDFTPNPQYESVEKGVEVFRAEKCDAIAAIGGGSAMDVAKCVKLYSNMDPEINYLQQEIVPNDIPFLAMPTTAGTGSEATRFAVIYYEGKKQSVTHDSCLPSAVLFDSSALRNLPDYHRKATMLDALCHAMEAFWSVNSTEESRQYAKEAIRMILKNREAYLASEEDGSEAMLIAANKAGKAINISRTTAGHAMCYKITSLYGTAHGHAAALVNRRLFPWMIENTDRCIDPRGEEYLKKTLGGIAQAFDCDTAADAAKRFQALFDALGLEVPKASDAEIEILKTSVNPERLKNHPIRLDTETIELLYHQILERKEQT